MQKITKNLLYAAMILVLLIAVMVMPTMAEGAVTVTDEETLKTAVSASGKIILGNDITLTEALTIPSGVTVTLDLNGHTISQTKEQTAAYSMIVNNGTLTIQDSVGNGKINYIDSGTQNGVVNYVSNTILNNGTLTVDGGTIENLSNATVASNGYPHAIDTNGVLTVQKGHVHCDNYSAIRIWCDTTETSVTVTGGTITGAMDLHNVNNNANQGSMIITGGIFEPSVENGKTLRLVNFGTNVEHFSVAISGGEFKGEIGVSQSGVTDTSYLYSVVSITGGTYTTDVKEMAAAGNTTAVDENGIYTIVPNEDAVASVGGVGYTSLPDAVEAADEGSTVYLLKSTEGSGIVIDKDVTIDFGTFTYSFTEPAVGSNGTKSNGFQILSGNTVTLQNGTLNVAAGYESQYYILIQNYADLTVTNMNLDGTNLDKYSATDGDSYVLSNNCGTVTITNTTITANDVGALAYAFDVCKYASYTAPTVTATNCTVTGMVEVTGGTLEVNGGNYKPTSQCTDAFIVSSGSLTIGGEVTVTGGTLDGSTAIWAKENGNVTINGGTYTITEPVSADVEQGYNDLIYARDNAVVTINDGHFSGPARTSDNQRFLLNLKDNCAATFTVKGGTFVSFNPADTGTEPAGVNDNFLADGYCVGVNGTAYTVGTHSMNAAYDDTHHFDTCDHCGAVEDKAEHSVDTTSWGYDADGHWHSCSGCEYHAGFGEHEYSEEKVFSYNLKEENDCVTFYWLTCECGRHAGNEEDLSSLYFAVAKADAVHAWDEGTVTTEPTCSTSGEMAHACTNPGCAATKTEEIATTAHTPGAAATCTTAQTCTKCDTELAPALGHDKVLVDEVSASCTETGMEEHYDCSRCDAVFYTAENQLQTTLEDLVIDALGHTEETVPGKAPTCTEDGLTEGKKCSVCGVTTVAQNAIPATGHKGGEATCEKASVCEVCGKEYGTGMSHTLSLVEAKAPTCTDAGNVEHAHCIHCGKTFTNDGMELTTVTIPATGHTPGAAATCTTAQTCTECGEELAPALGHDAEKVNMNAATCTGEGNVEYYHCSVCEKNYSDEACTKELTSVVISATGHKLVKTEAKAATCTEAGNTEHYTCEHCDKLFSDAEGTTEISAEKTVIAAKGHTDETVPGKAPTCTETGLTEGKKCSVCGTVTVAQETIAATGHTEETVAGKAPTCTETGLTEGKKCSVCDTVTVAQETIPAIAHTLETVPAVDATYFAPGNIEHHACSVCGKLFDAEGKELTAAEVVIAQLIKVEDNKADVSTGVVDNAIEDAVTSGTTDIVIDVTKDQMAEDDATTPDDDTTTPDEDTTTPPVVTKTDLPVASLDQVADLHEDATLTVNMTDATVTLDKTTLEVVADKAKTEGSDVISLEIERMETTELAPAQQEAIEDKEVEMIISASILVNNTEIHDFEGGNVTVSIPFTPAEGTEGEDYVVLYIADDGSIEEIPTTYANGTLVMTLGHFSEYVVVNTNAQPENPGTGSNPSTADGTNIVMLVSLMVLSLAAVTAVVISKEKFLR